MDNPAVLDGIVVDICDECVEFFTGPEVMDEDLDEDLITEIRKGSG